MSWYNKQKIEQWKRESWGVRTVAESEREIERLFAEARRKGQRELTFAARVAEAIEARDDADR